MSKYYIGQMILTETILDVVKRELRRLTPGVKIENDEIEEVLRTDIIKRDVLEGEKAIDAKKKIQKAANNYIRNTPSPSKKETKEQVQSEPSLPENDKVDADLSNNEKNSA